MFDDVQTSNSNQGKPVDEPIVTMPGMGQPLPPTEASKNTNEMPPTPPVANSATPNVPDKNPVFPPTSSAKQSNIWLYILIVVLAIIVIGVGGYIAYQYFLTPNEVELDNPVTPTNNNNLEIDEPINNQIPTEVEPVEDEIPPAVINVPPVDTDGDGLTDQEEIILGTSINLADTDRDGLSDYDEVRVYLTDPNNPDTDGDSFLDGEEIENGYDPKGPGKLLNLQIE